MFITQYNLQLPKCYRAVFGGCLSADLLKDNFSIVRIDLNLGRSPTGHPTVDVNWCRSNVDHLKIHFSKSSVRYMFSFNCQRCFIFNLYSEQT